MDDSVPRPTGKRHCRTVSLEKEELAAPSFVMSRRHSFFKKTKHNGITTASGRVASLLQQPATATVTESEEPLLPPPSCNVVLTGVVCLSLLEQSVAPPIVHDGSLHLATTQERRVAHSLQRHWQFHWKQSPTVDNIVVEDDDDDDKLMTVTPHTLDDIQADVLARQAVKSGDLAAAIVIYEQLWQQGRPAAATQLAVLHLAAGHPGRALQYARQALTLHREASEPLKAAQAALLLGLVQYASTKLSSALKCWREATQLSCLAVGYEHITTAILLCNIGVLHADGEDLPASLRALDESLELQRSVLKHAHVAGVDGAIYQMATTMANLGIVLQRSAQFDRAAAVLDECRTLFGSVIEGGTEESMVTIQLQRIVLEKSRSCTFNNISIDSATVQSGESGKSGKSHRSTTLFGNSDGIPDRRVKARLSPSEVDHQDFIVLGALCPEWTAEQRVRKTVLTWFGRDIDNSRPSFVSFDKRDEKPESKQSIPVDLDADFVPNAELRLKQIHTQAMRHLDNKEIDDALDLFRSALRSHRAKYGDTHHLIGSALHNLGLIHMFAKQYPEAFGFFSEAVDVREKALGPDHPDVQTSKMKMALIRFACQDFRTAEVILWSIREKFLSILGYGHPQMAKIMNNVGAVAYEAGDLHAAYRQFELSYEYQRRLTEEQAEQSEVTIITIANILSNMAYIKFKQFRMQESLLLFQEALKHQQGCLLNDDPIVKLTQSNIDFLLSGGFTDEPNEIDICSSTMDYSGCHVMEMFGSFGGENDDLAADSTTAVVVEDDSRNASF